MKTSLFIPICIGISIFIMASKCNKGEPPINSSCLNTNEDNLAKESACFAATIYTQGNPFPSPITTGGTVKLKMKIAAIDAQLMPLSATVTTKVFNAVTGQLVSQTNVGTIQSSSSIQDVPVWNNVNVSAGTYYLEVLINVAVCGSKSICLSDKRIVVN